MFELYLEAISASLMLFFQILQIFPQNLYLIHHLSLFILGIAQSCPQFSFKIRDNITTFGVFVLQDVQLLSIVLNSGCQWKMRMFDIGMLG